MSKTVYFKDNFFSSGETDITDAQGAVIGTLDLQSMFTSGVTVRNDAGEPVVRGQFRFMARGWHVYDRYEEEIGVLKAKFAFFKKRYVYESVKFGEFLIESPAFSREYTMTTGDGRDAAHFRRVSGFFAAGAYELTNRSELPTEELVVVIMGVHAYIKQQQSSAAT
ncbi:hypothetical protein O9H85_15610 [Paenibacillus filicis]|uniref:LURP-one-related family protein n=1 Tax=Paenibacillus gyeongsangnamensis TaxID=3388067 RepID=A0ABT4QAD2_9BACL|nr:hypothetical protein [Paenibacillus filicis]MCZ8513836.1 hypothetical protein [Paenibacillus filicis]